MKSMFSVIAKTKGVSMMDSKVDFKEFKVFEGSIEEAQSSAVRRAEVYGMEVCVLEMDLWEGETDGKNRLVA